jgi:hypothetical protein
MELEQWASNWAATCPGGHRPTRKTTTGSYFGENIYWSSGSPVISSFNPKNAVAPWYNEVKDFPNSAINPFKFIYTAGHYTQVVWAKSTRVGCGVAVCKNAQWATQVVCNYGYHNQNYFRDGGNMQGGKMYSTTVANCANGANS